jgi:hypothetical protein
MRIVKKTSFYGERGFPHWDRASWAWWGRGRGPSILHEKRDSLPGCAMVMLCRCAMLMSDALPMSQRRALRCYMVRPMMRADSTMTGRLIGDERRA